MPFDDKVRPPRQKAGLKINNNSSNVVAPKAPSSVAFEEAATQSFEKKEGYKARMHELGPRFRAMVEDRVLPQNKSPISKSLEDEVFQKLLGLAKEMNADALEPEAEGAVILSGLLLKMVLFQRDIINNLAFKVEQLEKNASLVQTEEKK
jgi:hypothetical protein